MDTIIFVVSAAGLLTGISKFPTGGMGLIIVPILTIAFAGPKALAVLVPMYIFTDILAVFSYRKGVNRKVLVSLLPIAGIGLLLGTLLLFYVNAEDFQILLATIILFMLGFSIWRDLNPEISTFNVMATRTIGLVAGMITILANAAGPLVSLFLLEKNLAKEEYVATRAWIFLLLNLAKVPLLISIDLLTIETAQVGLYAIPALVLGSIMGYFLLQKLSVDQFKWAVRVMSGVAAVYLLV